MRRALAVAVVALWVLIGLPGTAHAGGPTSVLITEPATGRSTALYYTSADYAELERILATDGNASSVEEPLGIGGADYNLTWMIHDVEPWRVDTVHITGDGTAFVTTRIVLDHVESEVVQGKGRVVAQSDELVALLDRIFSRSSGKAPAPQPVVEQQEPAAAPAEPSTRWFSLTGWRWVVPGVVGGLLVGLVSVRRRTPGEPRRVLVDRSPTAAASDRSATPARR